MASSYYDSSDKTVYDGDVAQAADLNAVNVAVDTAFQLVEDAVAGAGSDAAYYAGLAEDSADAALVSEGNASDSEIAAAASESAVAANAAAAAISETNAAASETAAASSESNAATSESNASTSETNASASETKANEWAEKAEDVEVETGEYSALHHAAKAEASATAAAASESAASGYEADVVAAGAAQIALVEQEGTDQYNYINGLSAVLTKDDPTGAAAIPSGTTAERPTVPAAGDFRFNSTESEFEGYDGSEWGAVGGGTPIGTVIMWITNTAPSGYLICNGGTYAYDTYPELGALLGGSPGGNFNVPNINTFVKNSKGSNTLGTEAESVGTHGHTANTGGIHNHTTVSNGNHAHNNYTGGGHTHSASTNSTGGHSHSYLGRQTTGWNFNSGGSRTVDDMNASLSTGSTGTHSHSVTVNSVAAHDHGMSTVGAHTHTVNNSTSHTHTINNHSGTNQPACMRLNFCIKAE